MIQYLDILNLKILNQNQQFKQSQMLWMFQIQVILSEYKKCLKTLKIFQNSCHLILLTMIKHSLRLKKAYYHKKYILDPHGAIGYLGLKKYLSINPKKIGVFLETAHPIKFSKHIEKVINRKLTIPDKIKKILEKDKNYIDIKNYSDFKKKMLQMEF